MLVAARLALLFTSVHLGHFEESRQGNLAVMLLEGRPLDLALARPFDYEGSSVISALLAVPAYAVLGRSGTSLKVVMLLVTVLILGGIASIARREEGPGAAWAVGLVFVFGPSMFVSYGFDAVGGAWWGCALNVLILGAALAAFRSRRRAWIPLWAFSVGLALFFHPSCLVAASYSIVLLVLYRWPDLTPRLAAVTAAAFAAGLLPAVLMGLGERSTTHMILQAFVEHSYSADKGRPEAGALGLLDKTAITFALDIPHALAYRLWPWLGYLAHVLLGAAFVAIPTLYRGDGRALLDGLRYGHRAARHVSVATVVTGFVLWYMLLYLVSDISLPVHGRWVFYDKNFKVFYNLLPFAILAAGLAAGRTMRRGRGPRAAAWALIALLALPGVASTALEMAGGRLALHGRYPAHDMKYLGRYSTNHLDMDASRRFCERHAGPDLPDCLVGVGERVTRYTWSDAVPTDPEDGRFTCAAFAPADRHLCYRGVGWHLNWGGRIGRVSRAAPLCRSLAPYDEQCLRGYMLITPDVLFDVPPAWLERHLDSAPELERELLGPGFGVFLAHRFASEPELVVDLCGDLERRHGLEHCRESAARELGWIAGKRWSAGVAPPLRGTLASSWSRGLGERLAWRYQRRPEEAEALCGELAATGGDPASCVAGVGAHLLLMSPRAGAPLLSGDDR
jgi:hypothetical protein